jgi:amino acid permease
MLTLLLVMVLQFLFWYSVLVVSLTTVAALLVLLGTKEKLDYPSRMAFAYVAYIIVYLTFF